jgi:hypothetical protein
MPLLMCPNDNVAMQTLNRSGVEFDICPTCRGVWLDRGELEKLMGAARDHEPAQAAPPQPGYRPEPPRYPEPRYEDRHYREHRWDDDDYRRRKRRGDSIFDIFD